MNRHGTNSTSEPATGPPVGGSADISGEWTQHEHVADSAKIEAQKLVDTTGSPELAKQAIDAAVSAAPKDKDELALRLGFVSYLDLFEASMLVRSASGESYYVTCDHGGRWLVWSERILDSGKRFATREDAENSVRSES
jgi:hypothetical protein